MSENFIELTEDEFDNRFPLVTNHLNPSAGWGIGESGGCLFETYGEELAFVVRQDLSHIWTLIDGEDGDLYVTSGFHFVNRIGYLISREAVPQGTTFQVHIPVDRDEDFSSADI